MEREGGKWRGKVKRKGRRWRGNKEEGSWKTKGSGGYLTGFFCFQIWSLLENKILLS